MGLKVLSALDSAKAQYYHFKAIIIAGMGLFTDAYNLFCIPPVMILIGRIYYNEQDGNYNGDDHDYDLHHHHRSHRGGVVPPFVVSVSVAIALLGAVFGNVVFGRLADQIGRKRVYGFALLLMIFSSIGCGLSICRTRNCVMTSLCFFRFMLGVGIGGDYPISATIMSEFANKTTRGAFIATIFSMQGFGILASSGVTMILCAVFNAASKSECSTSTPKVPADIVWRLILMFGAVPAAMTYYWRMMMPETARYTALVEQNIGQAVNDMEKVLDVEMDAEELDVVPKLPPSYGIISKEFFRRHGRDLFACASVWFLVDVVFYSSNLFQSQIYHERLPNPKSVNGYREAFEVAKFQAIVAISSTIPGYWAAVIFIDRIGRVKIQIIGFLGMAICMFAIGIPYYKYWVNHNNLWFLILYALTFFFPNLGPNTTTFIVPAELFPTRFRSTCHGISGAAGNMGAIIGSIGFLWASPSKHKNKDDDDDHIGIGMTAVLVILGGICVLGIILTYFFMRETNGRSLEENEVEVDDDDNNVHQLNHVMDYVL